MKIVLLVYKLSNGGAERVASLWASGFAERGYEVDVITSCPFMEKFRYKMDSRVRVHNTHFPLSNRLATLALNKSLKKIGITDRILKRLLHTIKPDVIIGVMPPFAWNARTLCTNMDAVIINTEHNAFEHPASNPMPQAMWEEKFIQNKEHDLFTVLTQADKDLLGAEYDNAVVLPNPLTYQPVTKVPNKEKIILACGRLNAWHYKGFDLLIQAWSKIAVKYPEWKLQIAGDGSQEAKDYLVHLAKQYNIQDTIIFMGFREDILELYKKSEIFVLSSRYEGFGMVLVEAMSQGCACIACDYKGRQKEIIIDETQGLTCPPDDAEELAKSIDKMISDDNYRKSCQRNAIERSKFYSLNNTMDRWDSIFKKLKLI